MDRAVDRRDPVGKRQQGPALRGRDVVEDAVDQRRGRVNPGLDRAAASRKDPVGVLGRQREPARARRTLNPSRLHGQNASIGMRHQDQERRNGKMLLVFGGMRTSAADGGYPEGRKSLTCGDYPGELRPFRKATGMKIVVAQRRAGPRLDPSTRDGERSQQSHPWGRALLAVFRHFSGLASARRSNPQICAGRRTWANRVALPAILLRFADEDART